MIPTTISRKSIVLAFFAAAIASTGEAQSLRGTLLVPPSSFAAPVALESPPGDARLFVCDQYVGTVSIIKDGAVLPSPFLDLGSEISTQIEQGLLGIAFHPDFTSNRTMFVSFTDTSGDSVIRSYQADVANPDVADLSTVQVVFGPLAQPMPFHNGGCIKFGPDEMLYFGLGDGGDNSQAQDLGVALGKMLRLDVDAPFPHVPVDNPHVGDPNALDLIWASGLRNPWRFSFDSELGDLWIADVGWQDREEINFQAASSLGGENYGWACLEGTNCTSVPQPGCQCTDPLNAPVHEYMTHVNGTCAVIGGHVYHGQKIPSLRDRYVFADFCGGFVWSFAWDGSTATDLVQHPTDIPAPSQAVSLSLDSQGELYLLDKTNGKIWSLEEDCQAVVQSYCVTSPNSAGSGALIGYTGSTSIFANDFALTVSGAAPTQNGIFYYGPRQIQIPFGEGFRCVGAGGLGVHRLNPALPSDPGGSLERLVDFDQPPASSGPGMIQPGDTWNFQYWYRDPAGGGSAFNLSDALQAEFCP